MFDTTIEAEERDTWQTPSGLAVSAPLESPEPDSQLSVIAPYRLDATALTLAVGFAMMDFPRLTKAEKTQLERIQSALWREDPETVAAVYNRLQGKGGLGRECARSVCDMPKRADVPEGAEARRVLVDSLTAGWVHPDGHETPSAGEPSARPKRTRQKQNQRHGVTVPELAQQVDFPREAVARALEHHGYLEMVPYGGRQKRRLVTRLAEGADYGRNVDPSSSRSVKLDGAERAAPFPVFYPERLPELIERLDFAGIREKVGEIVGRRAKLAWMLEHHSYLPNDFIASLTGYSEPGVRKARGTSASKSTLQVRIGGLPEGPTGSAPIITTDLERTAIASCLEVERDERPSEVLTLNTTTDPEMDSEAENSVEAWCTPLSSAVVDNSHLRQA